MPEYAVMTFMFKPWWKKGLMSHETMLQGFAAAGARGVEPFHRDFIEDAGLLPGYRRALAENNLRVAAVDIMCNLVYADARRKREGRDNMRQGLDICHALDADIAHVAGHRMVEGVTAGDGRKMIAEGLLEAVEIAASGGMTVAIENFNPSPGLICSAADCLEIMELTGNRVKFVFDTGNFIAVGEKADANFEILAERICHCHFKDFIADPARSQGYRSCDLGTGEIPNAAIARKLVERGYDGWVALETYGRDEIDPVSAVRTELPLLRSWFE